MTELEQLKAFSKYRKEYNEKDKIYIPPVPTQSVSTKTIDDEYYASTTSLDPIPALIIYLIVMAVGTIFNDRILIWMIATAVYVKYRKKIGGNKHDKRKA